MLNRLVLAAPLLEPSLCEIDHCSGRIDADNARIAALAEYLFFHAARAETQVYDPLSWLVKVLYQRREQLHLHRARGIRIRNLLVPGRRKFRLVPSFAHRVSPYL